MDKKALLKLADYLSDKVEPKKFDMNDWGDFSCEPHPGKDQTCGEAHSYLGGAA